MQKHISHLPSFNSFQFDPCIQKWRNCAWEKYCRLVDEGKITPVSRRDDRLSYIYTPYKTIVPGIQLYDINDFAREFPEISHAYFSSTNLKAKTWEQHIFTEACFTRGVAVVISPGVKPISPLDLSALLTPFSHKVFEKIVIVCNKGSEVVLQHMNRHADKSYQAIDVVVNPCAKVTYIQEPQSLHSEINIRFHVEKKARLDHYFCFVHGQNNVLNTFYNLEGDESTLHARGVAVLDKTQTCSILSEQNHRGTKSKSSLGIKTVLNDSAQFSYQGNVYIDQTAKQAEADQQNSNILLSCDAKAYSRPSLEALTNDIMCGHGSAIGQIDQELLWYCQSRGLSDQQARTMMLKGFLSDIFPADFICFKNSIQEKCFKK